jgi:hypothetical protein
MKKLCFMLAIAAGAVSTISATARAEWISYQRNADTDELVEAQAVSREGSRVKIWTLTNYGKPMTTIEGQAYASEKMLTTVDCASRKAGAEQVLRYSDANAAGEVVSSMETPLRLLSVKAGSTDDALLNRVCR